MLFLTHYKILNSDIESDGKRRDETLVLKVTDNYAEVIAVSITSVNIFAQNEKRTCSSVGYLRDALHPYLIESYIYVR